MASRDPTENQRSDESNRSAREPGEEEQPPVAAAIAAEGTFQIGNMLDGIIPTISYEQSDVNSNGMVTFVGFRGNRGSLFRRTNGRIMYRQALRLRQLIIFFLTQRNLGRGFTTAMISRAVPEGKSEIGGTAYKSKEIPDLTKYATIGENLKILELLSMISDGSTEAVFLPSMIIEDTQARALLQLERAERGGTAEGKSNEPNEIPNNIIEQIREQIPQSGERANIERRKLLKKYIRERTLIGALRNILRIERIPMRVSGGYKYLIHRALVDILKRIADHGNWSVGNNSQRLAALLFLDTRGENIESMPMLRRRDIESIRPRFVQFLNEISTLYSRNVRPEEVVIPDSEPFPVDTVGESPPAMPQSPGALLGRKIEDYDYDAPQEGGAEEGGADEGKGGAAPQEGKGGGEGKGETKGGKRRLGSLSDYFKPPVKDSGLSSTFGKPDRVANPSRRIIEDEDTKPKRVTPMDMILAQYNKNLKDLYEEPPVDELPSNMSDNLKLTLLNTARFRGGLNPLDKLPETLTSSSQPEATIEEPINNLIDNPDDEIDSGAMAAQLRKQAENLALEEAQGLTNQEKRQANLVASRRGREPPFPDINPDSDPFLFKDYDDSQLKDYRDDLFNQLTNDPDNQAIRDEITGIDEEQNKRGQQTRNDLNQDRQQNLQNQRQENLSRGRLPNDEANTQDGSFTSNVLGDRKDEPSATIQDITDQAHTDPNIFKESERNLPTKSSIFKNSISAISIVFIEIIKQIVPVEMIQAVNLIDGMGIFPFVIEKAVGTILSSLSDIEHTDIAGLRGTKKGRQKLRMISEEHKMLKNPIFYPFIILAIKFYTLNRGIEFDLDFLSKTALKYALKNYLKLPSTYVDYAFIINDNFPPELKDAYLRNTDRIVGISDIEKPGIKKYINLIEREYANIFKRKYLDDVKKTEHGNSTLPNIINNLDNPKMLNVISNVMNTIDNFILSVADNKNVLLGLMGLIYAEANKNGQVEQATLLANSNILGYVYFKGNQTGLIKKEKGLEALKQMSKPLKERRLSGYTLRENNEKVSMWEDTAGNSIITIRGTDLKDNQDLLDNFANFAGSKEFYETKRIKKARILIKKKLKEISNLNKGSLRILGYSLGGASALKLSKEYPEIKTTIYNPVISNSDETKKLMKDLKTQNSNIEFFYVESDPISSNLKKYINDFKMTKIKKKNFLTSHSLENY